ncbi:MAG: G5 domain-containing protein [Eubacteriaceae bacterium]|nr:G5 domain-containing protein [Eubacteriaceae bacterium]
MNILGQLKTSRYVRYVLIAVGILILIPLASMAYTAYATVEYWDLMAGDKTVAVFVSENDANQVVKDVTNYYVKKGAKLESVKVKPQLTVAEKTYNKDDDVKLCEVKDTVEYLVTGTREKTTYKVKEGDTFWTIAEDHDMTVKELSESNPDIKNTEKIMPGDELNIYKMKPIVKVTTTQVVETTKKIKYKTIARKTDELYEGETKVKREGKQGKRQVTERIVTENGVTVKSKELKSKTLKKAVNKIVLKGTKKRPVTKTSSSGSYQAADSTTYSGDGSEIANYAMQFIGNPYVYGGTSLTNGADCSGFVQSVYKHFGINLPRVGFENCGKSVPYSEARPGDIMCSPGHYSIYVGNGRIVHAIDEAHGINVTSVSFTGPIYDVRRIVD